MAMRWILTLLLLLPAAVGSAQERSALTGPWDRLSYAIGVDMGRNFKSQGIEVETNLLAKGMKDVSAAEKSQFSEKELQIAMTVFHVELGWGGGRTVKASPTAAYGIGVDVARKWKLYHIKIDPELVEKGLKHALSGENPLLSEEDLQSALAAFQFEVKKHQSKLPRLARSSQRGSETIFLTANRGKEGVLTLKSGLQYKILTAGSGRKPRAKDTVEVHYRGTFIDGTEFGNSYSSGQPVKFKATGGIPGIHEALKLMPAGSKWQIFIPSSLAFRPRGWGLSSWPTLPLIIELELVGIKS